MSDSFSLPCRQKIHQVGVISSTKVEIVKMGDIEDVESLAGKLSMNSHSMALTQAVDWFYTLQSRYIYFKTLHHEYEEKRIPQQPSNF